jgi:hypothetical protein
MDKLDYSPVLKALKQADQVFTEEHGITHFSLFDAALESAAEEFNKEHGTTFDTVEARHQYLDLCEAEPNPFVTEDVNVDDLVVSNTESHSIH